MADGPSPEARELLKLIEQVRDEQPDPRDKIWQAWLNERREREGDDPETDALVAELVSFELIEEVDRPLPHMKGPASFRYRD